MTTDQQDPSEAVSLRGVSVHFFKKNLRITALHQISLSIPHGSFVALLGPSGCGKTTILNCIAGLEKASSGRVVCNGRPVTRANVGVGYLTQRDALLPWRTIEQNLRLPFQIKRGRERFTREQSGGTDRVSVRDRVAWAIDMVGLTGFEHHYPRELSGGMLKRAALAQTLAYSRDIILMDEPFGALDSQLKLQLHRELLKIWDRERRTIVFVTHDIEEALALSDTIVLLASHPGRIKQIIDVDLPRPRDPVDIRFDPRFRTLHRRIWSSLELPTSEDVEAVS